MGQGEIIIKNVLVRSTIFIAIAIFLLDVAQAAPAPDCSGTNLPSYSEIIQPGVKEKWDEYSRLTQGVCRLERLPKQNECIYAVQLGSQRGETVYLCWYGEPPPTDPGILRVAPGINQFSATPSGSNNDKIKSITSESAGQLSKILGSDQWVIRIVITGTDVIEVSTIKGQGRDILEASPYSLDVPDITISMSRDAFLSLLNSEDTAETFKRLVANGNIDIKAKDIIKQAEIKAAIASGAIKGGPFGDGSDITINGAKTTVKKFYELYKANVGPDNWVVNKLGIRIGALGPRQDFYEEVPKTVPVFFNKPPGVLAQNPGLIYDTVTKNNNVMGPHNVFKINPGLKGPNDILAANPNLIGPADMALINPNLHGPAEFAYVFGIGAHSKTAQHLLDKGLIPDYLLSKLGKKNRWGNTR